MKHRRYVDVCLFLAYALWCVVLFSVHEPWRDEVQSWLLARDLSFPELLSQLRYDGHPAGWFLLLWPLAQLGLPFVTERILHTAIVLAAGGIVCFKGHNLAFKLFLLLATPMMYELPALSRNYAMSALALLVMAVCHAQRHGRHCAPYCVALFFLINSNIYGTIAGIALLGGEALLLLLNRLLPAPPDEKKRPSSKALWAHGIVGAASLLLVYVVVFSDLLLPLNSVPLHENAHFSTIQNYGFGAERLSDAAFRIGGAVVLGALPADIDRFAASPLAAAGVPPGLTCGVLTVVFLLLIAACIAGAAMCARKTATRLWIAAVGAAAFAGNLIAVAVTTIFNIRHAVPLIFVLVYLWWTALEERGSPAGEKRRRPARALAAAALACLVFVGAFGLNAYRSRRDILYPYSMAEETAAFLKEHGYDSPDVLVLAANHPQVSTILGFTDQLRTFRFVYGDCSFAVWQVYNSDFERSVSLEEFVAAQLRENRDDYRAILFIGARRGDPLAGEYPLLYDSGGGAIMQDEGYLVLELR